MKKISSLDMGYGDSRTKHFDDACGAMDLSLSSDDVAYLEELYIPHGIVGQITHNGKMY